MNADSYVSTGQGLTSSNMFAYCGNNPVNRADGTGQFWLLVAVVAISLAVTLGGCSQPTTQSYVSPSSSSKPSATSSTTFSTVLLSISPTQSPQGPSQQEKSYAATVYAEAGGQNKRSKQAVAHVMNNRVGTRSSWTDIEAVISAEYQFEGYGSPMYNAAMEYYNTGICENPIDKAAMDECLAVVIPIYDGIEADITVVLCIFIVL